jgi:hypothetical protein
MSKYLDEIAEDLRRLGLRVEKRRYRNLSNQIKERLVNLNGKKYARNRNILLVTGDKNPLLDSFLVTNRRSTQHTVPERRNGGTAKNKNPSTEAEFSGEFLEQIMDAVEYLLLKASEVDIEDIVTECAIRMGNDEDEESWLASREAITNEAARLRPLIEAILKGGNLPYSIRIEGNAIRVSGALSPSSRYIIEGAEELFQ